MRKAICKETNGTLVVFLGFVSWPEAVHMAMTTTSVTQLLFWVLLYLLAIAVITTYTIFPKIRNDYAVVLRLYDFFNQLFILCLERWADGNF